MGEINRFWIHALDLEVFRKCCDFKFPKFWGKKDRKNTQNCCRNTLFVLSYLVI